MGDTGLTPYDIGTFGQPHDADDGAAITQDGGNGARNAAGLRGRTLACRSIHPADRERPRHRQRHGKRQLRRTGAGGKDRARRWGLPPGREWQRGGDSTFRKWMRARFVTGAHRYTSDFKRPGMLYGRVLRPAGVSARTRFHSISEEAEKLTVCTCGARRKFRRRRGARSAHSPETPSARCTAKWKDEAADLEQRVVRVSQGASRRRATRASAQGSFAEEGWKQADHKVEAVTTSPTSRTCRWSRAPLWPNGTTASLRSGRARSGRSACALNSRRHFSIPEAQVRVIVPDTGSGVWRQAYGRMRDRSGASGQGSRESRSSWCGLARRSSHGHIFVPAGVIDVRGGVRKDGRSRRGSFTTTTPAPSGLATPVRCPEPAGSSSTNPIRRCGRAPTGVWRRRQTTSRVNRIWMSYGGSGGWIRWRFG